MEHTQYSFSEHQLAAKIRYQSYQLLAKARQFQKEVYEYQSMEVEPTIYYKAQMSLSILNNEIVESDYKIQYILPIFM